MSKLRAKLTKLILKFKSQIEVDKSFMEIKIKWLKRKENQLQMIHNRENFLTCQIIQMKQLKQLNRDLAHLFMIMKKNIILLMLLKEVRWYLITELSTMANGQEVVLEKEEECKFGKMVANILVIGKMIKQTEKVDSYMLMEMFMTVNGIMIKLKGVELINIPMVLSILVIGRKIDKMVMELKLGQIMLNMKETTNSAKNTELELLSGPMVQHTLVNFSITTFMEKVFTRGQITESMRVNGMETRCMEKEHSPGLMEENMLENMLMIKRKDTVNSFGLMEDAIVENGSTVNNMVKVLMLLVQEMKSMVNGKKAKELDGLVEVNKSENLKLL